MSLYERIGGHEGIARLLPPFYADVRQHQELGPVFHARITDWPSHLEKIAEFWARQTGGASRYGGGFGVAHLSLGIGASHLDQWLQLWDFNCRRQLPPQEAAEMSELAHRIGGQLLRILDGRPGLSIGSNSMGGD